MTIQDEFYNYQSNPKGYDHDQPPFESCAPAAHAMRLYTEQRWGLTHLGCHGDRPIVSGTSLSSHAYGAAGDLRYETPGPGLFVADTEIIPWLIATSKETGLQAIHHYRRSLIWRPPGTSGRALGADGWRVQPAGAQMGKAWALWLHLEFLDTAAQDGRLIEEKLLGAAPISPAPAPAPVPNPPVIINPPMTPPASIPGATHMIEVNVTTVRRGSTGDRVRKAQGLINANFISAGDPIGLLIVDGTFGPRMDERVRAIQAFFGMFVDGVIGPRTWQLIINIPLT